MNSPADDCTPPMVDRSAPHPLWPGRNVYTVFYDAEDWYYYIRGYNETLSLRFTTRAEAQDICDYLDCAHEGGYEDRAAEEAAR